MVYGMLNKYDAKGDWTTKFARRIGDYKFYNFKFDTPTMECEEGFHNFRLRRTIIDKNSLTHYREIMKHLDGEVVTELTQRNVQYEGRLMTLIRIILIDQSRCVM